MDLDIKKDLVNNSTNLKSYEESSEYKFVRNKLTKIKFKKNLIFQL